MSQESPWSNVINSVKVTKKRGVGIEKKRKLSENKLNLAKRTEFWEKWQKGFVVASQKSSTSNSSQETDQSN